MCSLALSLLLLEEKNPQKYWFLCTSVERTSFNVFFAISFSLSCLLSDSLAQAQLHFTCSFPKELYLKKVHDTLLILNYSFSAAPLDPHLIKFNFLLAQWLSLHCFLSGSLCEMRSVAGMTNMWPAGWMWPSRCINSTLMSIYHYIVIWTAANGGN